MYKYYWTTSEEDFRMWDNFLSSTKRGHYLQLSDWLSAYCKYGFKVDLLLVKDHYGDIVGGAGIVISKFLFLKFCSCSCGPIIKEGQEEIFKDLTNEIKKRFSSYRPICSSIHFPILKDENNDISPFCLNIELDEDLINNSQEGSVIKAVISNNGFRVVKFTYDQEVSPEELVLKDCNLNAKRNIKKALKNDLTLYFARNENEISEAYALIELNAKYKGYPLRAWDDFKDSLINMVESQRCLIAICKHNDELKGALIVFDTGKRFTYISGGILREETDLKVGHFLQYQMLKLSIEKGYDFYDISIGGSPDVIRFKEGFGGKHVEFIPGRYWVHNRFWFWLYIALLPMLKKHKVFISKVLKMLK